MDRPTITKSAIVISIISGLLGALILSLPAYWQVDIMRQSLEKKSLEVSIMNSTLQAKLKELEMLQESLEKKPELIIKIFPDSQRRIYANSTDDTIYTRHFNLTISKKSTMIFNITITNIGNVPTHIVYSISCVFINNTSFFPYSCLSVGSAPPYPYLLGPNETWGFEYVFHPPGMIEDKNGQMEEYFGLVKIMFGVQSTESLISDYVMVSVV